MVFGSSFFILTMSISFLINKWTCWQHLTGFLTKSNAVFILKALVGFICSLSAWVNSLSCCKYSCNRFFTLKRGKKIVSWFFYSCRSNVFNIYIFWYLLLSQSLSNSPFVLALLTICTNIGVNSPSRASSPLANAAAVICTLPSSLAYIFKSWRKVECSLNRPKPCAPAYSP